ncbi:hypothetical protein MKW92_010705 [Papaver armeniacum]|nr:hypothetical protein MKW92_010705 [Papaver armeniacum]
MRPPMTRDAVVVDFRGRSDGGGRGGRGGGRSFIDGGRGGRGGRGGEIEEEVVAVAEEEVVVLDVVLVGMKGGSKVIVEPHRHEGVFIAKGKEDALVTRNMVPGKLYMVKRFQFRNEDGTKIEYRVWNPFRSKLAAAILGGVDNIWIVPGARVLYLGAASGTTVSHVLRPCWTKERTNVIPIIEDARHPAKYRMLVGMVDVIFSDVAQPDMARILALNASYFLRMEVTLWISIKVCSLAQEVKKLQQDQFKPSEQVTLEPFEPEIMLVLLVVTECPRSKGLGLARI